MTPPQKPATISKPDEILWLGFVPEVLGLFNTNGHSGVFTAQDNPAPLDKAQATMNYWANRGIAKNRLVMGIPFFVTSFSIYTGGEQSWVSLVTRYNLINYQDTSTGMSP